MEGDSGLCHLLFSARFESQKMFEVLWLEFLRVGEGAEHLL